MQSRNQIMCRGVDNNKPFKTCNSARIIAIQSTYQLCYRIGNDLPIGVGEGTNDHRDTRWKERTHGMRTPAHSTLRLKILLTDRSTIDSKFFSSVT